MDLKKVVLFPAIGRDLGGMYLFIFYMCRGFVKIIYSVMYGRI